MEIGSLVFEDFTDLWVRDFEIDPGSIDTSDIDNPVYDDTYAGIDFHRGSTWTLDLVIEGSNPTEVRDNLDRVKAVWRDPKVTKTPGADIAMTYTLDGRRRTVYGRPRRFAAGSFATTPQGFITALATFKLTDPLEYDSEWATTRLDSVPPDTRGLVESLTEATLTTEASGTRQGQIGVPAGMAPTPFVCTIYGPITNPAFSINGRSYVFDLTIGPGQRLEIDSRTGTVLYNGYSNRAYTMRSPTQLKGVRLQPGQTVEVSFSGVDDTLTAYAVFKVRPAFY